MSNHTGTLLRIIGIFVGLIGVWFGISLVFTLIIVLITPVQFNVSNALYVFGILLFIRIFYPRYIFKN
ncbi:MAG: hypothetical protein ACNI3C_06325 [Candidatus Marinarcus sp.]|uniref:hypothetical protein n=1 Tax=Candidatus Marinarcus sp. TaxID=3100987 RepID=UPI003B00F72D